MELISRGYEERLSELHCVLSHIHTHMSSLTGELETIIIIIIIIIVKSYTGYIKTILKNKRKS